MMKKGLKKIKITRKRAAIIKELKNRIDHPAADEIYFALKKSFPSLSIATVYRNLKTLADFGIINEIESKNKTHFDGNTNFHYHLKCVKCGNIIDLDWQNLNQDVADIILQATNHKYEPIITGYRLEFSGICQDCAKKNRYKKEEVLNMKQQIDENEKLVLEALKKLGISGTKEIASETKLESKAISKAIKKLKSVGLVESPARCKYSITKLGTEQL